jgi:hypothetical protein
VKRAQKERDAARKDLAQAQASIRAMVGQVVPGDVRQPIDPPQDHVWTTSTGAQGRFDAPDLGRLYCSTCTAANLEVTGRVIYAAECLELARVRDVTARLFRDAQARAREQISPLGRWVGVNDARRLYLAGPTCDEPGCPVCSFLDDLGIPR